jgi:hypothetical protein
MTLEEAAAVMGAFLQNRVTVEGARPRQVFDENWVVDVWRADGTKQTFENIQEAALGVAAQLHQENREGTVYAILGDDGIPIQCDSETWKTWMSQHRGKEQTKITCSPDVEATIAFSGESPSYDSMDGRPKFWNVMFYSAGRDEHYGLGPMVFETRDEAQAHVTRYIAGGCPPPGTTEWLTK